MRNVTYISAGAGSGKTYCLTDRLASILSEGRIRGENILMTTFTDLAAGELKKKAKAKLYSKGMVKESEEVDMATIGTIHSVATAFLEKYWYLLGLSPSMNVLNDEDRKFFFDQSISDILSEEDASFLSDFAETFDMRDKITFRIDREFWKRPLEKIVDSARLYSIKDLDDSLKATLEFTAGLRKENCNVPAEVKEVKEALESFKEFFGTKDKGSNADNKRRELIEEAYQRLEEAEGELPLKDLIWFQHTFKTKFNTSAFNDYFSGTSFFLSLDSLYVSENLWDYVDEYIRLMFSIAEKWREEYSSYKKRMKVIDFDDMERYFLELLDRPEVMDDIRTSYKTVFVDEYQDCSPLQVKMFDKISDLVDRSYWVGDLKQAIYGFRGTDTNLVQNVVSKILGAENSGKETLSRSWRSCRSIVDFTNNAFSRAFSSTLSREEVVLESVRKEEGSLTVLNAGGQPDCNDSVAKYVISLIGKGEKPSDIAVLFRYRDECSAFAATLRDNGIRINTEDSVNSSDPVVELMISILSLVINPNDRLSKAKIARISVKGATTGAIIDGLLTDSDNTYLDSVPLVRKTLEAAEQLRGYPVSKAVESLVIELNLYDRVREIKEVSLGKEKLNSIIASALDYENHALAMALPATLNGFIIHISGDDGISIPGDTEGVNILTMHKSKGLEWKNVIIGSLSDDELSDRQIIKNYFDVNVISDPDDEDRKTIRVLPWIFGRTKSNFDEALMDKLPAEEIQEIRKSTCEEIKRLLYVAITRAKDNLCLVEYGKEPFTWMSNISLSPKPGYEGQESFDCFSTGNSFSMISVPEEAEAMETDEEVRVLIENSDERLFEPYSIQPSSVPPLEGVKVTQVAEFDSRITVSGIVDYALAGTAIHDVFCVLEKNRNEDFVSEIIREHGLSKEIPDSNEIIRAWDNLEAWLVEHYGRPSEILHECPFTYWEDGFTVTGTVDLVWDTPEGAVLIDFKTFPGKKESILSPEDSHYAGKYSGQFSCYRKALEKSGRKVLAQLVYYPVAGCIVKLEY